MLIHTYFTDGMFDWGVLFLNSYKKYHGESNRIVMTTRELGTLKIKKLYSLYNNLEVINKSLPYRLISKRAKIPIQTIKKYKRQVENNGISMENKVWKQYISVEDRYRNSIVEVMNLYPNEDHMMHIDIDMIFRGNIEELFNLIRKNDVSIRFRKNKKRENKQVLGSVIGFSLNKKTREFMRLWIKYIDSVPLRKKPKGFGQTSFYYAYRDLKDLGYSWGNIPNKFTSVGAREDALIWAGNKGRKNKTLKKYQNAYLKDTK